MQVIFVVIEDTKVLRNVYKEVLIQMKGWTLARKLTKTIYNLASCKTQLPKTTGYAIRSNAEPVQ